MNKLGDFYEAKRYGIRYHKEPIAGWEGRTDYHLEKGLTVRHIKRRGAQPGSRYPDRRGAWSV